MNSRSAPVPHLIPSMSIRGQEICRLASFVLNGILPRIYLNSFCKWQCLFPGAWQPLTRFFYHFLTSEVCSLQCARGTKPAKQDTNTRTDPVSDYDKAWCLDSIRAHTRRLYQICNLTWRASVKYRHSLFAPFILVGIFPHIHPHLVDPTILSKHWVLFHLTYHTVILHDLTLNQYTWYIIWKNPLIFSTITQISPTYTSSHSALLEFRINQASDFLFFFARMIPYCLDWLSITGRDWKHYHIRIYCQDVDQGLFFFVFLVGRK
jgi:hypothetical protein